MFIYQWSLINAPERILGLQYDSSWNISLGTSNFATWISYIAWKYLKCALHLFDFSVQQNHFLAYLKVCSIFTQYPNFTIHPDISNLYVCQWNKSKLFVLFIFLMQCYLIKFIARVSAPHCRNKQW